VLLLKRIAFYPPFATAGIFPDLDCYQALGIKRYTLGVVELGDSVNHVLLLGAGFSRNWKGWLATEIMEDLLGRLSENAELSNLLRRVSSFEEALSQVQTEYKSQQSAAAKGRLDRLQGAILDTFGEMNRAFAGMPSMEFSNDMKFSVQKFLSKFDAIFTLNQDLLFELHYNIEIHAHPRCNGHHFPGMGPRRPNPVVEAFPDGLSTVWYPMSDFRVEGDLQPIFKLHGSVNWRDRDGGQLLVMGANKQTTIREKQILNWYSDQFKSYLEAPNTRLMVIGYSFLDRHINEIIYRAWQTSQLKMFVVDPKGLGVFNKHPQATIRVPDPLEEIPSLGVSTRPLSSTFSGDQLEHGKLMRYFAE